MHLYQRFDSTPALLKHQTWACPQLKELLEKVLHVTLQLQSQEPAFLPNRQTQVKFSARPFYREKTHVLVGVGVAAEQGSATGCRQGSVFFCRAVLELGRAFCSWVKLSALSPPPRRRAVRRLLRPAPQTVLRNSATLHGIPTISRVWGQGLGFQFGSLPSKLEN